MTGPRRVLRYEVPVDDAWHDLNLHGEILHVDARRPDAVELWALEDDALATRQFKVFATGEPLPIGLDLRHIGTALVGGLVWHLMELLS